MGNPERSAVVAANASKSGGKVGFAKLARAFRETFAMLRDRHKTTARYKLLWERTPDMMLWLDPEYRIVEANAAAGKGFHLPPAEMLGRDVMSLCAPESAAEFSESLDRARTTGQAAVETTQVFKDGKKFSAEAAISSIDVDGKLAILVVLRDMTERKRAEESVARSYEKAVESSRLKSEFVATMSHEIRSPMNAVIGMNELLLDTPLNEEQREYTETVRDSSTALLGIIDDILDFSKIEAKGLKLEILDLDVLDAVESAVSLMAGTAQRKGISLMMYVDPKVPGFVLGDHTRLRQVLVNLIGNAIKFTDDGGVVVTVKCIEGKPDFSQLRFAVKDSGIGLDADTAKIIFEPFRQADGSTTRTHGGTGLGLSISRRLVDLMGGTLTVESTPGVGSEFSFDARFERSKMVVPSHGASVTGLRGIIVDNERSAQDVVHRYMSDFQMSVRAASSAAEAVSMVRAASAEQKPYDVAIVNYALPDATGIELAERMKADSECKGVRLVMLTPYDGVKLGEAAIAAGFSGSLPKPVKRSQLCDSIARAVRDNDDPTVSLDRRRSHPPVVSGDIAERPERILLVEDQAVNQKLVVQQLKKLGFSANAVSNGQKAISALAYEKYDLVLMDCQMPLMNGFEATRTIRKMEAHTGRHVPIVAMTANARREDREECLAAGMDDYLAKPVMMEHIRTKFAAWLPLETATNAANANGVQMRPQAVTLAYGG